VAGAVGELRCRTSAVSGLPALAHARLSGPGESRTSGRADA
jgi:hypothetical protein